MAFPTGWDRSATLRVKKNYIDATLSNFTTMVILTDANLPEMFDSSSSYHANLTDGRDIRFSNVGGTVQYAGFIELWDATNKFCIAWVKIPSISSSVDTDLAVYYANSSATMPAKSDTYGQYNAFDSSTLAQYSLRDVTTSTIENYVSASYQGTKVSANNPIETSRDGHNVFQYFDGSNDRIDLDGLDIYSNTNHTMSMRFAADDNGQDNHALYMQGSSTNDFPFFWFRLDSGSDNINLYLRNNSSTNRLNGPITTLNPVRAAWCRFDWVNTGSNYQTYVDAVADDSGSYIRDAISFNLATLGAMNRKNGPQDYLRGCIGHFKAASTNRSAAWLKAEHLNTAFNSNFIKVIDPAEAGSGGGCGLVGPGLVS